MVILFKSILPFIDKFQPKEVERLLVGKNEKNQKQQMLYF